eukprot:COSAG06_NODE_426_length_15905_cov_35.386436_1_plen_343_part_00
MRRRAARRVAAGVTRRCGRSRWAPCRSASTTASAGPPPQLRVMPFGSSGLGAAVKGVGVTELLEHPALFAEMRAALVRHRLLVLDAPGLTEQQQLTLGRLLGECQVHPTASLNDTTTPEIFWITNVDPVTDTLVQPDVPSGAPPGRAFPDGGTLTWHTDSSHAPRPSLFTMLYALEVPSPAAGGGTQFADMAAGFRALPPLLREQLVGMLAWHSLEYSRTLAHGPDPETVYPPPSVHPVIRKHPETGEPTIYLGAHAAGVVGMEEDGDGRSLIDAANEAATTGPHAVVHTHHWQPGQLLLWDNRALLHRGLSYDPRRDRRVMRRVVVLGDESRDRPIPWTSS